MTKTILSGMLLLNLFGLSCNAESPSNDKVNISESRFWDLMKDVSKMGKFILAVGSEGASANVVGYFVVASDGREMVLEKKGCKDHMHIKADSVQKIVFTHRDVGYGLEPVIEVINSSGNKVFKLYFIGSGSSEKQKELVSNNSDLKDFFYGKW